MVFLVFFWLNRNGAGYRGVQVVWVAILRVSWLEAGAPRRPWQRGGMDRLESVGSRDRNALVGKAATGSEKLTLRARKV